MSVSSASKGTLFFSFHRNIGSASAAERGNSSKCCTKTRMTVSGRIMATSSSRERKRSQTSATAALAALLLNESHLVNLFHGSDARANLGQAAIAQSNHALFAIDALDLRSRPTIHDHLPDAVVQVKQFANCRPAMIAGTRAFQASGACRERDVSPNCGIETRFLEFLRRISPGLFAVWTDYANEPLRHDAVQSGDKVVGLNTHVDEAADDVSHVVGVDGGENEVAGERRLDGDLGGFLVADFADHDLVWIVTQDGAQAAGEGEALLLVHGNLGNAAKLVFHGVFDRNDLVFVGLDLVDGGVERSGFTGARGTCNQDHAVGLADIAAEAAGFFHGETDNVQSQAGEFFRKCFLIEDAENR